MKGFNHALGWNNTAARLWGILCIKLKELGLLGRVTQNIKPLWFFYLDLQMFGQAIWYTFMWSTSLLLQKY